ncbi:MAG: DUF2237 domain-containing protein [Gammaproteobacteria bacterium]|jgi:uncharacterized protein (DUF2237 family)|tara:strand:+ start:155 stop:529 length:375 start_codon:yes stop_codon:yes gene_type:complete
MSEPQKNVLGEKLELCGKDPMTGFLRDGCCNTDTFDRGSHTVCAVVTNEFLEFSKSKGNDLSTPIPELDFKGLVEGDSWCLCADRWLEAYQNNKAPHIKLKSTNIKALEKIDLDNLKEYALDIS